MILHPDGRIEGTPEEIAKFDELRKAAPAVVPIPVIRPVEPWQPWPTYVPGPLGPVWCGSYGTTSTHTPDAAVN